MRTHPLSGICENFWRDFSIILNNFSSTTTFGRGSAPDPAERAYDAPPEPVVGCGGRRLSLFPSFRRLRTLDMDVFGAFLGGGGKKESAKETPRPQYKFLATRLHATHPLSKNSGYATVLTLTAQNTSIVIFLMFVNLQNERETWSWFRFCRRSLTL